MHASSINIRRYPRRDGGEGAGSEESDKTREILEAVGLAAQHVDGDGWADNVPRVLRHLATAADASRAYVFENQVGVDGVVYTSQRYEHAADGVCAQIGNPDLQNACLSRDFLRWIEILGGGGVLSGPVAGFPESEQRILRAQSIRSLALVPIFVGDDWWGFIGFDDCESERTWSETEIDALRAAANLFGAAVQGQRVRRLQQRLTRMANFDDLTELPNRRAIKDFVLREHARAQRSALPYCLALLDLDRFKLINDAYGHAAGDQVLRHVSAVLVRSIRGSDWLGRWGGEEFLLCLPETTGEQAFAIVERLRKAVKEAVCELSGHRIEVTLSAGVACWAPGEDTMDDLLVRADAGLYQAKLAGRNRVAMSSPGQMHLSSVAGLVQRALRCGRLRPAYQPIVELESRRPMAEETLARILAEDGRLIPACEFVTIAEQLQLLQDIDEALFRTSVARCLGRRRDADGSLLQFVNVSADLLRDAERVRALADLAAGLANVGAADGFPLVIELAERELIADMASLHVMLEPLLALGAGIAIDDFGGGHSSFKHLAHLPVSFLKIDGELIGMARNSPRARAIITSIRQTAESLGIRVIAECVEDAETEEVLRDLSVHLAQGYFYGRPVLAAAESQGAFAGPSGHR